jgi:hypothetical protein
MARPAHSYRAARRKEFRDAQILWHAGARIEQLGVRTVIHDSYPEAGRALVRVLQQRAANVERRRG